MPMKRITALATLLKRRHTAPTAENLASATPARRTFWRDRRGAVTTIVAATMPILVGFSALGIDMANVYRHRRLLQDTASAAALAGSTMLPDQPSNATIVATTATAMAAKNMPVARFGTVLQTADVQTGTWNFSTRVFTPTTTNPTAVRVTVKSTTANSNAFPLYFTRLIGYSTVDLTATATATFGSNKAWDITIIQDVTASLNSTQMSDAKTADQALLDCVKNNTGPTSQVGVESFTAIHQTKINITSVGTTSNYNNLKNAITGMNICGNSGQPACSGTNIAAGIQAGISQFTGGGYTQPSANFGKAIILVTDGIPNWTNSSTTNNGAYGSSMGGACTGCTSANGDSVLAANATAQADAAHTAGIDVFTIFLQQAGSTVADQNFLASLVRGNGKAYTTANSGSLSALMGSVCSFIPKQLVD